MQKQREIIKCRQCVEMSPDAMKALDIFRDVIKQGSSYVCPCCARALFSNQVCDREYYQQLQHLKVTLVTDYIYWCTCDADQKC